MHPFSLAGILRRIRRAADCSQRELAERIGVSKTAVAAAEKGSRDLPVSVLLRAVASIGGRLAILDATGGEILPMSEDAIRDRGDRLMPAHLDTRHGDEDWWGGPHRPLLRNPRYTFDRDRSRRDGRRRRSDVPADHHVPAPGDSLADRAAARQEAALRRQRARHEEEHRAWVEAGNLSRPDWGTGCTCPAACEYAERSNEDLAHAPECACCCDVA